MKLLLTTTLTFAFSALIGGSNATTTSFNASFDDLDFAPGSPLLNDVGIYKNINFINVNGAMLNTANITEALTGVIPHSRPNVADFRDQTGSLSTVYPKSKVKSLALQSFYFGCPLKDANSAVSAAAACTVTATGFKAGSKKAAAQQTFTFTPDELVDVQNPMTLGKFKSAFQGLQSVSFTYSSAKPVVLLADNFVGTTTM